MKFFTLRITFPSNKFLFTANIFIKETINYICSSNLYIEI